MHIKGKGIVSGDDVPTKKVKSKRTRKSYKRAKDDEGKFQADDPATDDINEAWIGGVGPSDDVSLSEEDES